MTPEQIAAMIADRESGTPGSWKVKFRKDGSAYMSIGGDRPGDAHSKFSIGLDSQYPSDVTNARRISRVPDMESTIIAQAAELERLRAERDALPEKLIDILHVLDVEAQTIANRISGMHGAPCRHPDGVQVLEDAETIIRAAFSALKGGA